MCNSIQIVYQHVAIQILNVATFKYTGVLLTSFKGISHLIIIAILVFRFKKNFGKILTLQVKGLSLFSQNLDMFPKLFLIIFEPLTMLKDIPPLLFFHVVVYCNTLLNFSSLLKKV